MTATAALRRLVATLALILSRIDVDAFIIPPSSSAIGGAVGCAGGAISRERIEIGRGRRGRRPASSALHLARKYVVIGGNLPGVDPDREEDPYTMSKKERRRRERERGAADFESGKYKTKKKKKASSINYDKLEEKVTRERAPLPRETRGAGPTKKEKLSPKAARIKRQRTAGGTVDSAREAFVPLEEMAVQIRVAKRGNKIVTMVQGLTVPMRERKALLKEIKGALGGGGAVVEGVLEVQGSHAERVREMLRARGYARARVV